VPRSQCSRVSPAGEGSVEQTSATDLANARLNKRPQLTSGFTRYCCDGNERASANLPRGATPAEGY